MTQHPDTQGSTDVWCVLDSPAQAWTGGGHGCRPSGSRPRGQAQGAGPQEACEAKAPGCSPPHSIRSLVGCVLSSKRQGCWQGDL
eukprot:1160460-Pelagomonas_calceolata.AAC.3